MSRTPGMAQVGVSRATNLRNLAFYASAENPFTEQCCKSMGQGDAYDKRREFERHLACKAEASKARAREEIEAEGGYDALVQWYRTYLREHH